MPTADDILRFDDTPTPPGADPYVLRRPVTPIDVVDYDPRWPEIYRGVEGRIVDVLGAHVLRVEHVGSTAVPGLAAKPLIDIDLTVARPDVETSYVPMLERAGFELTIREPWWQGHRMFRGVDPAVNLHVFGPDATETWKHLVLRDHLRRHTADRERYAAAKRSAAAAATAAGEHVMDYNARKEAELRDIIAAAFRAAGLTQRL